jgi:D-alanine-D-alanine ligase
MSADALATQGFDVRLIDPAEPKAFERLAEIDVALIALHGPGGEDGRIQGLLDSLGVPYTGSGVLASAVGMHKPTFKRLIASYGLDTPAWVTVDDSLSDEDMLRVVESELGWPVFVKPAAGGGSLGAGIVREPSQLSRMLAETDEGGYREYMVEEHVLGRPCSVGVLELADGLATLPVHDVETEHEFYDYAAKHDPSLRTEHCPSILPSEVTERLQADALRVHRILGAHGVSRVDFMVREDGSSVVLEINTVPGLSDRGNLATMARAAGIAYPDLVTTILQTAFTRTAAVA